MKGINISEGVTKRTQKSFKINTICLNVETRSKIQQIKNEKSYLFIRKGKVNQKDPPQIIDMKKKINQVLIYNKVSSND